MIIAFLKRLFAPGKARSPSQPPVPAKNAAIQTATVPASNINPVSPESFRNASGNTDYTQLSSSFNDFLMESSDQEPPAPNEIERFIVQSVEELLKGEIPDAAVPRLPDVAMALLKELADPEISSATIMSHINRDPVLASEVLNMTNSALFRSRDQEKTVNLEKAVVLLGLNNLKMIASSALMKRLMVIAPVYFRMFGQHLWQHSLDCAHACKALAKHYGQADPDNAYLVGLMHDIGKLAIFGLLTKALNRHMDYKPRGSVFSGIVRAHSHALSVTIARKWGLPDYLITALNEQQYESSLSQYSIYGLILSHANILAEFKAIADKKAKTREDFELLAQRYSVPLHLYWQAYPEGEA